jgi:MFS family permease
MTQRSRVSSGSFEELDLEDRDVAEVHVRTDPSQHLSGNGTDVAHSNHIDTGSSSTRERSRSGDNENGLHLNIDKTEEYKRQLDRNALRSVVGGIIIHLVLGNLYTWGIVTTAVTAYLRRYDPSLTYDDTLAVYITRLAFVGVFMSVGGVVQVKIGPRKTCLIGGLSLVLGTFLSAFVTSLVGLCFTDGVLFGIGVGISYSAPVVCATRWRPDRKNLISGIILAGFGGSTFFFGFIDTAMLHGNSHHASNNSYVQGYFPSDSGIARMVPTMYLVLSLIYLLLSLLGCFLLVERTDDCCDDGNGDNAETTVHFNPLGRAATATNGDVEMFSVVKANGTNGAVRKSSVQLFSPLNRNKYNLLSSVDSPQSVVADSRAASLRAEFDDTLSITVADNSSLVEERELDKKYIDMEPRELLADPLGWHITACYSLTGVAGIFITATYKTYGLNSFHDDYYLSYLGSSASLFNVCGRITWGALADRIGPVKTLSILSFFFAIILATYSSAPAWGGKVAFSMWTYGVFIIEGGIFSLYLPLCFMLFGPLRAGKSYGVVFGGFSVCNVILVGLLSRLHVDFANVSITLGTCVGLGFLSVLLLSVHIRKRFHIRV